MPLCCAADSPSSEPARGGEPRPVSLVRGRRSLHRPAARAAFTSMRGVVGDSCGSRPTLRRPSPTSCRSSAWRLGRAAVVVADGMAAAAAARPSLRPQFRSRRARGRWRAHRGTAVAAHTPYALGLLNGYPCLLCPCVVCFKFLQPKVIEGKKIDCALADPHLPRLLGGAPSSHNEPGYGNSAYCGHAITPCDSLSALLAVSCCTTDRLHSSRP